MTEESQFSIFFIHYWTVAAVSWITSPNVSVHCFKVPTQEIYKINYREYDVMEPVLMEEFTIPLLGCGDGFDFFKYKFLTHGAW